MTSTLHINNLLDKFKAANPPATPLALSDAQKYMSYCVSNVVNKFDPQEKVNLVCVLANLATHVPASLANLFDANFFQELMKIGCQKPTSRLANEMYKILNAVLRRTYFAGPNDAQGVLLKAVALNHQVVDILPTRTSHSAESEYLTMEFSAYLFYELPNAPFDVLFTIMDDFRRIRLGPYIAVAFEKNAKNPKVLKEYATFMKAFKEGSGKMSVILQNTRVDPEIPLHRKLVDKMLKFTKRYALRQPKDKDTDLYEKAGITANPVRHIVENYTLNTVYNTKNFLMTLDEAFRKRYYQQLVLATPRTCFPLLRMCLLVSAFILNELFFLAHTNPDAQQLTKEHYGNLQMYLMDFDEVFSALVSKTLELWDALNAENKDVHMQNDLLATLIAGSVKTGFSSHDENDDAEVVMGLLRAAFQRLNSDFSRMKEIVPVSEFSKMLMSLTYDEICEDQLRQIYQSRESLWGAEIEPFDARLELEVANFVREERTLQLINGGWFYAEDPRDGSGLRARRTKRCYVHVLPNRQLLMMKEFPPDTNTAETQVLEKLNARHVLLAGVKDVRVRLMSANGGSGVSSSNLSMVQKNKPTHLFITILTRNVFHKISLVDKKGVDLMHFYTDTSDVAYLWADGLKMLMGRPVSEVSEYTKLQISKLFDARRAVQFINIIDREFVGKGGVIEEVEGLYDYNTLVGVTEGFYFND